MYLRTELVVCTCDDRAVVSIMWPCRCEERSDLSPLLEPAVQPRKRHSNNSVRRGTISIGWSRSRLTASGRFCSPVPWFRGGHEPERRSRQASGRYPLAVASSLLRAARCRLIYLSLSAPAAMDTAEINALVERLVADHPAEWERFAAGDDSDRRKMQGFFTGQVMRETRGQADGRVVAKVLARKASNGR